MTEQTSAELLYRYAIPSQVRRADNSNVLLLGISGGTTTEVTEGPGLCSAEASVRIVAADVWTHAAAAGRLDPRVAADALIAQTVFAFAEQLIPAKRPNLHLLLELAAEIGATIPLPQPPESIVAAAAGKGSANSQSPPGG